MSNPTDLPTLTRKQWLAAESRLRETTQSWSAAERYTRDLFGPCPPEPFPTLRLKTPGGNVYIEGGPAAGGVALLVLGGDKGFPRAERTASPFNLRALAVWATAAANHIEQQATR
jgi:hypothetical protein